MEKTPFVAMGRFVDQDLMKQITLEELSKLS
jgi:hypothetical protein